MYYVRKREKCQTCNGEGYVRGPDGRRLIRGTASARLQSVQSSIRL